MHGTAAAMSILNPAHDVYMRVCKPLFSIRQLTEWGTFLKDSLSAEIYDFTGSNILLALLAQAVLRVARDWGNDSKDSII